MTASSAQLAAFVQDEQASEAQRLEDAAQAEADGGAAQALATVAAGLAAAWAAKVGTWDAASVGVTVLEAFLAGVRRQVQRALAGLGDRSARALRAALDPAAALGLRHGLAFAARLGRRPAGTIRPRLPGDVLDDAESLARDVDRQIRTALGLLTPAMVRKLGGFRGVLTGIGAARRAVSLVKTRIAWAVHRTVNSAAIAVADALNLGLLWIAEVDACPTCRAYSGRYAKPGSDFPGGISLDPRQRTYFPNPVPGPPRHPNCRCRVVPWLPVFGKALPNRLQAQARAA